MCQTAIYSLVAMVQPPWLAARPPGPRRAAWAAPTADRKEHCVCRGRESKVIRGPALVVRSRVSRFVVGRQPGRAPLCLGARWGSLN
jgi:hypothetical protein